MRNEDIQELKILPTPLITIITATYNAEKFLPATLDSICKLKYKNIEWIIVDGASTDHTIDIIKSRPDIISKWISEPDEGIYDAWNKGISISSGDWIAFIGAGDCYSENALNDYLDLLKKVDANVNFISSKVNFVDLNGFIKKTWGEKLNKKRFKEFMTIAHVGALHHKSLFKKNEGFSLKYSTASDYNFFLSNIDDIKAAFLNKITATMLIGGSSDSYISLVEKYKIQRKYFSLYHCVFEFLIAFSKKALRKLIKGF